MQKATIRFASSRAESCSSPMKPLAVRAVREWELRADVSFPRNVTFAETEPWNCRERLVKHSRRINFLCSEFTHNRELCFRRGSRESVPADQNTRHAPPTGVSTRVGGNPEDSPRIVGVKGDVGRSSVLRFQQLEVRSGVV